MTQNEVLAMLHKVVAENQQYTTWTVSTSHLVALVNQAVALEREACADICGGFAAHASMNELEGYDAYRDCEEAIRARGDNQ